MSSEPHFAEFEEGSELNLSCTQHGRNRFSDLHWTLNGRTLVESSLINISLTDLMHGDVKSQLRWENASFDAVGSYQCRVVDSQAGTVQLTFIRKLKGYEKQQLHA